MYETKEGGFSLIVVVNSDPVIESIVGTQEIKDIEYCWSQYVLCNECDDGLLIYNTLTCELIFLISEETRDFASNQQLIKKWFLVPKDFDEFSYAKKIKRIRQLVYKSKIKNKMHSSIEKVWILTTTACNAHCFYCHENGIPYMQMSKKTAEDITRYIEKKCFKKNIHIMWYGGEPTINDKVIDIISQAMKRKGIVYSSSMISNGYLFDEQMVQKSINLWHLEEIQITLDGLENTYNTVKGYSYKDCNPFFRVLNNIYLLLKNGIKVKVRLNIDDYNEEELFDLSDLLIDKFGNFFNFSIYSAPLFEECLGTNNIRSEIKRKQVYKSHYRLSEKLKQANVIFKTEIPRTMPSEARCVAVSNVPVIFPNGQLAFCHDYVPGILSGDIYSNEPSVNKRIEYTKCLLEKKECRDCLKYPQCIRLEKCFNNQCNIEIINEWIWKTKNEMVWEYEKYIKRALDF